MNNIILTDVDGVLLNWFDSFEYWMKKKHGHTLKVYDEYHLGNAYGISYDEALALKDRFNESIAIGWLPSIRDSLKYVRKLHEEHGYVLHCVTSICNDRLIHKTRMENLQRVFGKNSVERLVCVNDCEEKRPILQEYVGSVDYYIEDKIENADMAEELGLKGLLLAHDYNAGYQGTARRVKNWKEIYGILTGES